jgi:hypothetical protein
VIVNNIAGARARQLLGNPMLQVPPAPTLVLHRDSGVPQRLTVTLQATIVDNGSASGRGGSASNAVVVKVQ